jgi:polysaccharide chain length determinant protein (PEP-CTERM system associated)
MFRLTPSLANVPVIADSMAFLARRRWYFLIPALVLTVASVTAVWLLPRSYLSSGIIGVESQQIPEEFVRSTITTHAGERIGMMKSRVMTSSNLEQLIDDLQVYPKELGVVPPAKLAERLEENISVEVISDPYATRLGAIAFTVGFEHTDPRMAQAVAARLIELFLQENVDSRTERAADTTEFLQRQADKLNDHAKLLDQQIAEFKTEHRHALPEHLELKNNMLTRAETELRAVELEISSVQMEQRYLENQSAFGGGLSASETAMIGTPMGEQLKELQMQLAAREAQYLPTHPEVQRLRAILAEAQERLSAQTDGNTDGDEAGLYASNSQYASLSIRLNVLREQESTIRADINRLQDELLEIPLVDIELRRLTDQYEVAMEEFSEIRAKRHEAELAQSLEQEEKAERFTLLEPPEVPLQPVRSTLRLLALALLASVAGGAAVAYAAELLDNRIYGEKMLIALTGQKPLVIIPNLAGTSRDLARASVGRQWKPRP